MNQVNNSNLQNNPQMEKCTSTFSKAENVIGVDFPSKVLAYLTQNLKMPREKWLGGGGNP